MEVYGELSDQMMLMEMVVDSEGCTTPKRTECRIPEAFVCPPPPRKKAVISAKRPPPKNGYFQPPDLDSLFVMPSRRQACA